jgi:uncharacterized cupredoxin-like copper-binding protein
MTQRRMATLALVSVVALSLVGCSHRVDHRAASANARVTERDFQISAPAQLPSGTVQLAVHNNGPEAHELIVVRSDGDKALPLRGDGVTVDEDAVEASTAGSLEPGAAGSNRVLKLNLKPGRYEFFCNMAGHFEGGMHTTVTVH